MILLAAIVAGTCIGWLGAWRAGTTWHPPVFNWGWLVIIGFLPQLITIYLPGTRNRFSDEMVSASLITSQIILLIFCWLNRRLSGLNILTFGLALNLVAILANQGFMPLPIETAAQLLSPQRLTELQVGQRLGSGSKDILLPMAQIKLAWLADRFYPPAGFPQRFAFSLGDVLIAVGAFWMLAKPNQSTGGI